MVFCFGGIAIVALSKDETDGVSVQTTEFTQYEIGVVFALCSACLAALWTVTTRRIRDLHFSLVMFYASAFAFLFSTAWLLFYKLNHEVFQFQGGALTWIKLVMVGFCHFTASMSSTCAFQSMNPATVGMFMYMNIFYSYIVDVFVFDSQLNVLQFLGIGIILTFSVAGAIHKRFATPAQEAIKTE